MKKSISCVLANDVTLRGELSVGGDLELVSYFEHRLLVGGRLTMTPQAEMHGQIRAGALTIQVGAKGEFDLQVGDTSGKVPA
jgi:cytoskeletal protein CcmA (bactofilin family)